MTRAGERPSGRRKALLYLGLVSDQPRDQRPVIRKRLGPAILVLVTVAAVWATFVAAFDLPSWLRGGLFAIPALGYAYWVNDYIRGGRRTG